MKRYHLFIDESGTRELQDTCQNIYTLCGTLIDEESELSVVQDLNRLKLTAFGDSKLELKSNWMRIPEERKTHYLDPYSYTEDRFRSFAEHLYMWLHYLPLRIIAASINKIALMKEYPNPFNPNPLAYELLVQRVGDLCHSEKADVKIIFDDFPTGKTSAGNLWKDLLISKHKSLKSGARSTLTRKWGIQMNYSCLPDDIIFLDSKDSPILQISDLCAYNIRRQSSKYWNEQNQGEGPFYYWGYKQIRNLIHRNPANPKQLFGYGIVCFPLRK